MLEKEKIQEIEGELYGGREYVVRLLDKYHPADIAAAICLLENENLTLKVFGYLGADAGSEVLPHLNDETRELILEKFPTDKLGDIIEVMDSDDAADILGDVDEERAEDILGAVSDEVDEEVHRLMEYPEDTAGGIMQTELVSAPGSFTVTQTIEKMRELEEGIGDFHNIFLVDENNTLTGVVPLQKLIVSQGHIRVDELAEEQELLSVTSDTDQEEVANIFKKYDIVSLPVVSDERRLLGRILVDDIVDVVEEEADEDIMKMVGADDEALVQTHSAIATVRYRFPWLGSSLIGGFITGALILQFKMALSEVLALVAFIPVVMGISGNVGAQSSALVIRGIATGRINLASIRKYIIKEIKIGLMLGVLCGLAAGVITYLWFGSPWLGVVVGISIQISIVLAALMGTVIPLFFRWMNIDPAIAGGPIVLALNDISGILIFFVIAASLLNYLG